MMEIIAILLCFFILIGMGKISISFECSPHGMSPIEMQAGKSVDAQQSLEECVQEVLVQHCFLDPQEVDVEDFSVFSGKPLDSPFFLIGANEQQLQANRELEEQAIRAEIPVEELQLTIGRIVEKYNTRIFAIRKKED